MNITTQFVTDAWGPATQWTLLIDPARSDEGDANAAWEALVERYRVPITSAVKRQMRYADSAEDVARDFFGYLFEQGILPKADREKGRFRCYIQQVLRRYVLTRIRGDRAIGSDPDDFDSIGSPEELEFEREEERDWAAAILRNAARKLESSSPRDSELLFRAYGIAPHPKTERTVLREEHGLTEQACNVAIHRARKQLGKLLVDEVRETVSSERDFEEEMEFAIGRLIEANPELMTELEEGAAAPVEGRRGE